MASILKLFRRHRPVVALIGIVLVLTTIPVFDIYFVIGNAWQGFLPTFGDEPLYPAHVHAIGDGYFNDGNPYFLEHRYDPPLVIFGGAWLNALPLFTGLSFDTTLVLNFVVWSLAFAALLYWLFRELSVPPWIAVCGTILLYLQSYSHVWRPVNMQPVYPFYFLFYIALFRLIREQNRRNIILLAAATGASFYMFAYLWQIAVVTLGLLFLYALVRKNWSLLKATLLSSLIGGIIGLPVPLYTLWLSRWSPYFWESMGRFGLVHTHLPMAEVIYSGGWVGIVLIFLAILQWRARVLREDATFTRLCLFVSISGLGLWIMQGSNFITGILVETGEHVRLLILPWLAFATIIVGAALWKRRAQLTRELRAFALIVIAVCSLASLYYTYYYFAPFFTAEENHELWQTEQKYVKPFAWLQEKEQSPVVVWSDPHEYLSAYLPASTRHFTLFATFAMWELVPEGEIRERYLVSQYFNNPTITDLKNDMVTYLGRADLAHKAKTIERGIKLCRILYFWDTNKDCGTPPSPQSLLGDAFFQNLENKFQNDIKPNIKAYLKKYHVSYIIKDDVLNPSYHPEELGAVRVYRDDRYEIYHFP